MVPGCKALLPGQGPDLQEVDGGRGVFVLLGVRDTAAAGGELDV